MARHNLRTVIGFEFLRTISKPRFWIGTLSVPLIMGIAIALIYLSNSTTAATADAQRDAEFSIAYTDASGLITAEQAGLFGAEPAGSEAQAIAAVKDGSLDAYFAYPEDPRSDAIRVYGVDAGIFANGKYSDVAQAMLDTAVQSTIDDPTLLALTQNQPLIDVKTYADGAEAGGINAIVPPMLYIVIFYGLIVLLAGQMLASTLEEKENRVTEMILTTLNPTTLITGKVISLFMIGALQVIIFSSPIVIGYAFFREQINIPEFVVSSLIFDPQTMIIGLLLMIGGFSLFTTSLVALGAVMPTAKEAGNFMGVMIALLFIPFYIVSLVISNPQALVVQIFTYFPYSAPITALLRNGFGSLTLLEASIVIAILFICSAVMLRVAVKLFQHGSIAYTHKVSLKNALTPTQRHTPAAATASSARTTVSSS
ncbi:ABC transporter permease (plasmid) [Arthrobacter agilis]|uniref:ABC transporter permease n=1 Tax=Arthrobacter agilis TaxID=37921 RepID=UPI0023651069|nr:ABC transporter permease [Arthrobacter agilis]WDF35099.1 ABC transporter permease [Arthrobacter agilis]